MIDPVKGYKPKKRRQLEPPITRAQIEKAILWVFLVVILIVVAGAIWIW